MSMRNNEPERPEIIRLEETSSTNNCLRELLLKKTPLECSIVIADFQTAGKGQAGNVWESEAGKNLTFSIILYPDCIPANRAFLISQIAALSVQRTLSEYISDVSVKWPNDVYWKDRKICGMLIENDLSGNTIRQSIIGIGININQKDFSGDAPNPVSLMQITGFAYDREEILQHFRKHFHALYLTLLQDKKDEVRKTYRASLYRGSGVFPYRDATGIFNASIAEIEPDGHLVLRLTEDTFRRYAFKEVAFMIEE